MKSQAKPFDFDHWKELAATDPQGFEKRRREVIEREILRIPGHCGNSACADCNGKST